MKVIILVDSLRKGGKERRTLELLKSLGQRGGVKMELVLFKDLIEYPEVYQLDIPVHIVKRQPAQNPATFVKLYKICKAFTPDIIHAWSGMTAIFAIPSKILLNCPLVYGGIADAPEDLRIWDTALFRARMVYPFSDAVVGNSMAGLRSYSAPERKSRCIWNGFDFARIQDLSHPDNIRDSYGIKTRFIVGMVAAFADRKDYETYILGALQTLETLDDITFFAIGDGPNRSSVETMIPKGKHSKFRVTGNIDQVEAVVNTFDVGVLTTNSKIHGEGISNALMEYMALGKPVVATKGGGTDELVIDGTTGYVIEPGDPAALALQLHSLLTKPSIAGLMGMAARTGIQENFSLKKMTNSYMELYAQLLSSGR